MALKQSRGAVERGHGQCCGEMAPRPRRPGGSWCGQRWHGACLGGANSICVASDVETEPQPMVQQLLPG